MRKSHNPTTNKHAPKNSWSSPNFARVGKKLSPVRARIVNKALNNTTLNDSVISSARDQYLSRTVLDDKNATMLQQPKKDFNPKEFLIPGLTERDVEQLREVFDFYDVDKSDLITPKNLRSALVAFGFNATKETTYNIIAEYDVHEKGGLEFQEFLRLMVRGPPSAHETKEEIEKVFKMFDKAKKGFIDVNDLRNAAKELNEDIDEETLIQIVNKADLNMDKKINFQDFYNVMIRKIEA